MTQHSRDTPQFYLTAPSPCPYLGGKEERKVFTHLVGERAGELNNILTQGGFRRSQSIAYRPACEGCRACVSVRVIADEFVPTRSMRRIGARNADVVGDMKIAVPTSEQYAIFRGYLNSRHRDGGMADMTVLDYAMMVEDSHIETRIIEYRRREPGTSTAGRRAGDLIAVALTDVLADGLSMVYSFFEPDEAGRSLGTYMVLDHIARAQRMGLLTSISAIGCAARARWITRAVSGRRSGSRRMAGHGWNNDGDPRPDSEARNSSNVHGRAGRQQLCSPPIYGRSRIFCVAIFD